MSEYIIKCDYDLDEGWIPGEQREEVVRCRDCEHYNEKTYEWVNGWTRTHITCALFDGCRVEPTGFCKWAERREDG